MPNINKSKRNGRSQADRTAVARLREQTATVKEDIRELASTAGQAALSQVDPLEEFVRSKPLKSMLIAAGVGAALGFLFSRR
jgi:ElaB/YqjD/DUF883 family membrane-anchored ribosome-binding protein